MPVSLGANGGSYNYPQENDPAGWGDDATNWASAVSAALSNIGLGGTASADAVVNIISTTKGVLIPRMTTTQRNAIGSPSTSLLIYNTTTTQYELYTGSTWQSLASYISGTLTVTGAASLQSTLNVTGASTFANVTINGNETVNGVLSVTGNTTLANVTGTNATINGTLSVTGNTTLASVTGVNVTATGTILAASGTSGTPSISFSGDSNSGFYSISDNVIGVATNGTRVGEIGVGYGGFTGNVIQVVNTKFTSNVTITAAVNNTLRTTGIVGSITTKLANSKILIFINCSGIVNNLSNYIYSIIYRNTSTWSPNAAPAGTSLVVKHILAATPVATASAMSFPSYVQMDDPLQPAGTTLFYGDSMSNNGSGTTIEINYDPAGFSASRAYANITLMEIMV